MLLRGIAPGLLRTSYVVALAVWIGGFAFYSGVVIPALHDQFGDAFLVGMVTRRVTDTLNGIGVATLVAGWFLVVTDRESAETPILASPGVRLGVSTVLLAVLIVLHRLMDRMLETGSLDHFYSWHRAYLWASVLQWLVNLSLLIRPTGPLAPGFAPGAKAGSAPARSDSRSG
jgi:hypothetical protein